MSERDIAKTSGSMPVRSRLITFVEFVDMTGVHPSRLGELIELGWIEPQRTGQEAYLFRIRDVYRLRKLMRLMDDLELGLAGGTIVVDLLERIEFLENKVAELERLL